jgi:hypothetical protein
MEESATITQYYALAQANRRAVEKESIAESQKPNLAPKNAVAVLPSEATNKTAKEIPKEQSKEANRAKEENTRNKSESSANSSLGQNVDFVF